MSESREELEARIAAYIDGELPPAEAARLEVFLANTDPQLAEQVIGMLADKHRLRALPPVKAPSDLASRIMEQVERSSLLSGSENFANPQRPWWHSRGFIAAITILVIGGFSYLLMTSVLDSDSPWKKSLASNEPVGRPVVPAHTVTDAEKSGIADKLGTDGDHLPPSTPLASASPEGASRDAIAAPHEDAATPGVVTVAPAAPAAAAKSAGGFQSKSGDSSVASAGSVGETKDGVGNTGFGGGGRRNGGGEGAPVQLSQGTVASGGPSTGDDIQAQLARNHELLDNKSAEAGKLGFTPTASAQKALAEIVPVSGEQPIVLAFVAHDDAEAARFQSRLAELISQDQATTGKQADVQKRALAQAVPAEEKGVTRQKIASTTGNDSTFNYRTYNAHDRAFTNNVVGGNTASNFGPGGDDRLNINTQSNAQAQQNITQNVPQQTAAAPYRVALNADQLQILSREFDLRAVSRGEKAYAITQSAELKWQAVADNPSPVPGAVDETRTASPPAATEPDGSFKMERKDVPKPEGQREVVAPSTPAPVMSPQQSTPADVPADHFVDCIITIEPAK